MEQEFLTFIRKNDLFTTRDMVLLAVSGGVDSMVMLHLMKKQGFDIAVAHVNYGLRGADSKKDEELVVNWCAKNEIPCFVTRVEKEAYDQGESIQMVARKIRYHFFEELSAEHGFSKIATAHNLNDSLETVLLNLTKGTGIAGLTGIAVKRDNLIRPLLFATKEQVYAYAKAENLVWREDSSNEKNAYQRNLIRNEVIPLLRKINPNIEQTFVNTSERLEGVKELLDEAKRNLSANDQKNESVQNFDITWFMGTSKYKVLLHELIRPLGFNYSDIQDISEAILNGQSGKVFHSGSYSLHLDRDRLIASQEQEELISVAVKEPTSEVVFGEQTLKFDVVVGNDFPKEQNANIAFFDLDLLKFPMEVRSWQQGDVIYPLGLKGSKKVSDVFIDAKVPKPVKGKVPVLTSEHQLVWLAGLKMDDRFKVSSDTFLMLKVTLL
jgi:tRNA(Ile)-lysidine synthase